MILERLQEMMTCTRQGPPSGIYTALLVANLIILCWFVASAN